MKRNIITQIERNTKTINQLQSRMHEAIKDRFLNKQKYKQWQQACETFHQQHNELSFPGGFEGAYTRILNGDKYAMESAICFLECRPYFFRSGYMFKDVLKKAKRAPLNNKQKKRLQKIITAYDKYRNSRKT